VSEMYST